MNLIEYGIAPFAAAGRIIAMRRDRHRSPARSVCSSLLGKHALVVLVCIPGLAAIAPSSAVAAFTRPYRFSITQTLMGEVKPDSLAVDAEGSLWSFEVAGKTEKKPTAIQRASKFTELGAFDSSVDINAPLESLVGPFAIERGTGDFYVVKGRENEEKVPSSIEVFDSEGNLLNAEFGGRRFRGPSVRVAIDNSTDPADHAAGSIYVVSENEAETASVVTKFDSAGVEQSFEGCGSCAGYVAGSQIMGTSSEPFRRGAGAPEEITVGPHGELVVSDPDLDPQGHVEEAGAAEFAPSGRFLRSFTGVGTPGIGNDHSNGGLGGNPTGVAVDPASGHVLLAVNGNSAEVANRGAIDEYDSEGRFLSQITESSPGRSLHHVENVVADSHGDIYFSERSEPNEEACEKGPIEETCKYSIVSFGPGEYLPSLRLGEATGRTGTSAGLNGSVNPEGLALSDCHFEYVSEAAYLASGFSDLSSGGTATCLPAASSIPADEAFHPVSAAISGLREGVTYRYRLLTTTEGPLGGSEATPALAFTAPGAPTVTASSAANLSSTFADLDATIDPDGADTTYYFQYLAAAAYRHNVEVGSDPFAGASQAPAAPADAGSGGSTGAVPAAVLQHVGGLEPATAYEFRAVAVNAVGSVSGPPSVFATLAAVSAGLPDNRAYELVTPAFKGDAADIFASSNSGSSDFKHNTDLGVPAESGNGYLFETHSAFGSFPDGNFNAYVFSRGRAGWSTTSLPSPTLGVQSVDTLLVFDPFDLSRVGLNDDVGSSASAEGERLESLVGPPGGPYAPLHIDTALHKIATALDQTEIVGGSRDLSRVVLESEDHTLAAAAEGQDPGSTALYETTGTGECALEGAHCELINVDSEGALLNRCGASLGGASLAGSMHGAVSADGSRVIFTAPDPLDQNGGPGCWDGGSSHTPQLYVRSGGETFEASKPEFTDPSGPHPALYVGASSDGSRVFFVTNAELTADDAGIHDRELYEYDLEKPEGERLTRISAGESGNAAAGVWTVPAISEQGSAVYFTAHGQLTADALPTVEGNGHGTVDLYRYDTGTRQTAYVATVDEKDYVTNEVGGWFQSEPLALNPGADWYTTPDGRYLLFGTARQITGYDNAGPCTEHNGQGTFTGRCTELYRYDSATGAIVCVSCDPSGAPPVSNASFTRSALLEAAAGPVRGLSNDGSYAFFDTGDALVPQDNNSTLDVYEWHNGVISLISTGHDSSVSYFLGQSAAEVGGKWVEAANVFLGTHSQLVPADIGTSGDIYDARIDGGFPPVNGAEPCEGDSCHHPQSAPNDETPASLAFRGTSVEPSAAKQTGQKVQKKTGQKVQKHKQQRRPKRRTGKHEKSKPRSRRARVNHGGLR